MSAYQYDVYMAGPFFNDEQKAVMDNIKRALVTHGLRVADPRELGPVLVDMPPEQRKSEAVLDGVFNGNIAGMDQSWSILAWTDDRDTGTSFELGYCYGIQTPVRMSISVNGKPQNIMLARANDGHFTSMRQLEEFLTAHSHAFNRSSGEILVALGKLGKQDASE